MNNINPNLNIKFEDDFDININEEELIKNIDFSQFEKVNNNNNDTKKNVTNTFLIAGLKTIPFTKLSVVPSLKVTVPLPANNSSISPD